MAGFFNNGTAAFSGTFTGDETIPVDTGIASGVQPQTSALALKQVAGYLFGGENTTSGIGTATATAGAATLSRGRGVVTSEALTTAAGAVYTLTLTNTLVTASSIVLASVQYGTATAGSPAVMTIAPGSGSVVIKVQNIAAAAALDGTIKISFVVLK